MTLHARATAMLAEQHARLSTVIASNAPPEVKSLARHYLAKVLGWQAQPEAARVLALGEMGPNLFGASIDDVCRQAELHASRRDLRRRAA